MKDKEKYYIIKGFKLQGKKLKEIQEITGFSMPLIKYYCLQKVQKRFDRL